MAKQHKFMNIKKLVLFTICIILFANCEQEDSIEETIQEQKNPEEPEDKLKEDSVITYFTLNRSAAFSDEENWLVIYNQNGELLDYKEFDQGSSLVFEALQSELESTEELTITFIKSNVRPNNGNHTIKTYTGIEMGSVWDQKTEPTNADSGKLMNVSGFERTKPSKKLSQKISANYNIIVANVPGIQRYNLTSKEHYSVASRQTPQHNILTLNINEVELELNVEYFLSIEDGEGNLKYQFLFAPQVSGDINLDYADFLDYDHVLEVALPEHYHLNAIVYGYSGEVFSGNPLILSSQNSGGPSDSFARFGYINDYAEFDTYFNVRTLDYYGYTYEELGKIPDTLVVMEKPSFTIQDTNIEGFNFITDINYLRSDSSWSFIETLSNNSIYQTQWSINRPAGSSSKIAALPEEIIEKYATLNLDKLKYISTSLSLKGRTYDDILNSALNSISVWPPVYEWVTFYNSEQ